MSKYSKEQIDVYKEQIRQQVTIAQVVERYTGKSIVKGKCNCPLHTEKTASFTVDERKQLYYCFGCGSGGDIFKFVQTYLGLSFVDAIETIDSDFALGLIGQRVSVKAQIAMREAKKKRELEQYKAQEEKRIYDIICTQYRLIDGLIQAVEPMTELWSKLLTKRAWLEYELDRLL